jgi:hypothetical protein
MEVNSQLHTPAALILGREPRGTHWIGGWSCPTAGLGAVARRKYPSLCRESNPVRTVRSLVTILFELRRLHKTEEQGVRTMVVVIKLYEPSILLTVRGCVQKFPDWPPGARIANVTALCHKVQLYLYFMSQSSEFCRHNHLCCFLASVYCCKHVFRCRLSPESFDYTLV